MDTSGIIIVAIFLVIMGSCHRPMNSELVLAGNCFFFCNLFFAKLTENHVEFQEVKLNETIPSTLILKCISGRFCCGCF